MKVLMIPSFPTRPGTDGIARVVEAYQKYLPEYGVEFVHEGQEYDIKVAHAGVEICDVCMLHGLYWTADYDAAEWEWETNRQIVNALRQAKQVTVPSAWVAETLQRDMRLSPTVVPHGIEWDQWQHKQANGGYVLWNKNRIGDVCNPIAVAVLANRFPGVKFMSTFAPTNRPGNVTVTGRVPFSQMKLMVQRAGVYLATTKETLGIGLLEAMASGVPVLAFAHGGAREIVQHGISGYLAKPGDWDDLSAGLAYCLTHRDTLGENGRELAKAWTWRKACEIVAGVYQAAIVEESATVGVVIPFYNKSEAQLRRAIDSAIGQSYKPTSIAVIDDGSQDERLALSVVETYRSAGHPVVFQRQSNSGVAIARNRGIGLVGGGATKYLCCLDADDWLAPDFLKACVEALESDRSLGIAYTGLQWHKEDGTEGLSQWPPQWNYDKQLQKQNQVPTCCVFRREMWERLGGYRQRYAPTGAGAEDAEYWTRAGAYGWKARKVTEAGLFHYSFGGQVSSNPNYREVDWLAWHPWVKDGLHPFASYATPKRRSHPVRQYDEPAVSVVIPVGPGHEGLVVDALDSLEAQTFRQWEAIVVCDGFEHSSGLHKAYPYVKWGDSGSPIPLGAGWARNRGASLARAPFLVFLDADDWLHPTCLQRFLDAWSECQSIVYSDYVGKAIVTDPAKLAPDLRERLYSRNEKTGESLLGYRAAEYDCTRAMRPLEDVTRPYYWCNVTALIPKAWHDKAGGFDEALPTWEDVEYHWRLAGLGYPYQRIPEELMLYRLNTGTRRENSGDRQTRQSVIKYIREKLEGIPMSPCPGGCGGKKSAAPTSPRPVVPAVSKASDPFAHVKMPVKDGSPVTFKTWEGRDITVVDADLVLAKLVDGNKGSHRIIGPSTRISYGHHSTGQEFLVHRSDLSRVLEEVAPKPVIFEPPPVEAQPLPAPVPLPAIAQREPLAPVPQPERRAPLPPPPPPIYDLSAMNMAQIHSAIKDMNKREIDLALQLEQEGKKRPGVIKALTKAAGK